MESRRAVWDLQDLLNGDEMWKPPGILLAQMWALLGEQQPIYGDWTCEQSPESGTKWYLVAVTASYCAVVTASSDEEGWTRDWEVRSDPPGVIKRSDAAKPEAWSRRLRDVTEIGLAGDARAWHVGADDHTPDDPAWTLGWPDREIQLPTPITGRSPQRQRKLIADAATVVEAVRDTWIR